MTDSPNPSRNLSEISHLFLSGVRDRQAGGMARPVRKPPRASSSSQNELTPEELAGVSDAGDSRSGPAVTAIIASHLGSRMNDRARDYAASRASAGQRVALVELDPSELRISIFGASPEATDPVDSTPFDPRQLTETLEELAWDIDRWLVVASNTRVAEARGLLKNISHWVMLTTCDHDGVVSAYRALKGMSDFGHPRLSLAVVDAMDDGMSHRVHQKLAEVSRQFLGWTITHEPPVRSRAASAPFVVLSTTGHATQWQIVESFFSKLKSARQTTTASSAEPIMQSKSALPVDTAAPIAIQSVSDEQIDEVVELPAGVSGGQAIVDAVIRSYAGGLVGCPVKPPICPDSTLAVDRDRRIVLLAVSKPGLSDLRTIGEGYQWLVQNRSLVAMAVPQLSIDAMQMPKLQVLVDQSDISAQVLSPLFQNGNVEVKSYRKLRWGAKTGVLLEAA